MRNLYRAVPYVILLTMMLLVSIGLYAQDDAQDNDAQDNADTETSIAVVMPDNLAGAYVLQVESGTFTVINEEQSIYRLTLHGVDEQIRWIFTQPYFDSGTIEATDTILNWAFVADLVVNAVIHTDEAIVDLQISAPEIGPEQGVVYIATIDAITSTTENAETMAGQKLPTTFTDATIYMQTDNTFFEQLLVGLDRRERAFRRTTVIQQQCRQGFNCPPGDPFYRSTSPSNTETTVENTGDDTTDTNHDPAPEATATVTDSNDENITPDDVETTPSSDNEDQSDDTQNDNADSTTDDDTSNDISNGNSDPNNS